MPTKPNSTWLLIGSFLTLLGSILAFKLIYDPPKIANIFKNVKPAALNIVKPEKIFLGQPFKINLVIDSAKQDVNAVGIYLKFESDKIQILDLDTTESFCQFYPEKKFDNHLGTVTIACGSPHPGFSGTNTLATIELMPLAIGTTHLAVDPNSKVLLSDGRGTNTLTEPVGTDFVVQTTL